MLENLTVEELYAKLEEEISDQLEEEIWIRINELENEDELHGILV